MEKFSRWYDKYPDLKSMLELLEKIDDYTVELIAQDFIQIVITRYGAEFDKVIEKISKNVFHRKVYIEKM